MKPGTLAVRSILALLLVPGATGALPAEEATFALRGDVIDATTRKPIASRVYIESGGKWFFARSASTGGTAVRYDKQNWINKKSVERHTSLSAHPFVADLPAGTYTITVERGKEYRTLVRKVTITDQPLRIELPLERWIDMASLGWFSADTHVHLGVDELPCVMLAEDLNVSFPLTWWVTKACSPPRAGDKNSKVPAKGLIRVDPTHVIATRNTEYEIFSVGGKPHTLGAVFALNHREPLTLGVPPVEPVARAAHGQGALLDLDKHNWPWSIALVPIMNIDLFELANNHMWRTAFAFTDFGTHAPASMKLPPRTGKTAELHWILYGFQTYYALLNCGFRLRPTAGTASGVHPVPLGFSRVYVHVDGEFTFAKWFRGLGEGRSFVTTGPMLLATVDGRLPGAVFRGADAGKKHGVRGRITSAVPLRKIEIVVGGRVVHALEPENQRTKSGAYESAWSWSFQPAGSTWLAVRAFEERPGGRVRFAHTGPFHFQVPGSMPRPAVDDAAFLVACVRDEIQRSKGVLPPEAIAEYERALEAYTEILRGARE